MDKQRGGFEDFIESIIQHLINRDYRIIKTIKTTVFDADENVDVCEVLGGKDDGLIFGKVQGTHTAVLLDKKEYEK